MVKVSKSNDPLLEKILTLIKEKYSNQKAFAEVVGIAPSSISDWKSGKTKTYTDMQVLPRIAEAFEMDVSELLSGIEKTPARSDGSGQIQPMNEREQELILIARELDPERQDLLLRIAAAVAYKDVLRTSRVPAGVPGP